MTSALLAAFVLVGASPVEPDGGLLDEAAAPAEAPGAASALLPVDAGVPAPAPFAVTTTARFGEGVTFQASEFRLNLRGRIQVLGLAVVPGEESSVQRQNAFMVRRARLALRGQFPWKLSMNLQLAFANQDMEPDAPNVLRDFNVQWAPLRDLQFRLGQMKVPFDVQRVVSSSSLQFPDRATSVQELNLDRDVGLVIFSDDFLGWDGRLRYALGVFGGDGRNRIGTNVGLLYSARVRFSVFGVFDDKAEGDVERSAQPRLAFGAAVARNVQTNRPRSTLGTPYRLATFSYTHATGDVHFKWHGVSLLSEVYWRQADAPSRTGQVGGATVTEWSRSGWGYFVQGGVFVLPWLELAARFSDTRPIGPTDPAFVRTREFGSVLNFMFSEHDFKIHVEAAWLDDGAGRDGRFVGRIQTQVFF
jgi:hypothetical protein